jgi:hypothetical protein
MFSLITDWPPLGIMSCSATVLLVRAMIVSAVCIGL